MIRADLITVFHNDDYLALSRQLFDSVKEHEPRGGYRLIGVDNRRDNRGFAAACNLGAFGADSDAPVIGFLNPDVQVSGPFIDAAANALTHGVVITGCRFAKPDNELAAWGVRDWVCGATFFVDRKWFMNVGGFDTQFVWSFEETDLIRRAEAQGLTCRSINLPLDHSAPTTNTPEDHRYKTMHFAQAAQRYQTKWARRRH